MMVEFRPAAFYAMTEVGAVLPYFNPYAYRPIVDDHPDLLHFRAESYYVDSMEDLRELWGK